MPNFLKTCKVCGKQYETCRTLKPILGRDRWQDVACCPEHGAQWFAAIYASRAGETTAADEAAAAQETPTEVVEAAEDNGETEVKAKQPRRKKNDNDVTE